MCTDGDWIYSNWDEHSWTHGTRELVRTRARYDTMQWFTQLVLTGGGSQHRERGSTRSTRVEVSSTLMRFARGYQN